MNPQIGIDPVSVYTSGQKVGHGDRPHSSAHDDTLIRSALMLGSLRPVQAHTSGLMPWFVLHNLTLDHPH